MLTEQNRNGDESAKLNVDRLIFKLTKTTMMVGQLVQEMSEKLFVVKHIDGRA